MDGVGWAGVVFIWLSFLWPIIASVLIYALKFKSAPIARETYYWIMSIACGYTGSLIASIGIRLIAAPLMFANDILYIVLVAVSLAVSALIPFGVSFYVANKCR